MNLTQLQALRSVEPPQPPHAPTPNLPTSNLGSEMPVGAEVHYRGSGEGSEGEGPARRRAEEREA